METPKLTIGPVLPVGLFLLALAGCDEDGAVIDGWWTPDGTPGVEGGPPADIGVDQGPAPLTCPTLRSPLDRADDSALYQVRPLYVLPFDGADEKLDTNGAICTSVQAFTSWLSGQAGGRALRLDTHQGELDIGFVRLGKTDAEMRGTSWAASIATGYKYVRDRIEAELRAMGPLEPTKIYAVYYGGSSIYACGGGAYPPTLVGQVAAVYIKGQPEGGYPCSSDPWGQSPTSPHYLDYSMLHEMMHTLGLVAPGAPHHHSGGHVFDGAADSNRDLMYQPRPSTSDPPWDTYNPAGLLLDINGDDYFDHGTPGLLDLAQSVFISPLPAGAVKPAGW